MTYLKNLMLGGILIIGIFANISAQSFTCDGTFYISLYQDVAPTTFYEITTNNGINFDELFDVPFRMNSTGLSTVDQNIYAITFESNEVFRVEADGTTTSVFTEPDINLWNAAAGAVNNNGVYAVHDRNLDMIFLYQTGSTVTKLGSVELFWDASTGNTGLFDHNIDDLVFDPFDDTVMYTYQRSWDTSGPVPTQGHLLKVNVDMSSPDFGMVSSVGLLDPSVIVHLGSLFFDTNGALHGYGANATSPLTQERLVKINQNNADIELLGIGPQASGVDGCSCRNPMKLTKTAEIIESTCDSNYIEYRIGIENFSMLGSPKLKLKDTLSFAGQITSMNFESFDGTGLTSGGVGSDHFIFEDFELSGIEKVEFSFIVATALSNTFVNNQARLYENLEFSPIDSDDPTTMEIADPTAVFLPALPEDTEENINMLLCPGQSITINGEEYDSPGEFQEILTNQAGCDSLINIVIVAGVDSEGSLTENICTDDEIIINEISYMEEGVFTQDLTNEAGCDSILFITIIVDEETTRNEEVDLCPGEIIIINGTTYSTPGFYVQMTMNAAGCDSIINITVMADGGCDDCTPSDAQSRNNLTIEKTKNGLANLIVTINSVDYSFNGLSEANLTTKIMEFIKDTRPNFSNHEQMIKCHSIINSFKELRPGKRLVSK